jgi:chromosome segregation ATPase
MMGLFGLGKKKKDKEKPPEEGNAPPEDQEGNGEEEEEEEPEPEPQPEAQPASASEGKIFAEITKMKAQLDSLAEMRKVTSERFTRVSEQVGELRGMIMDTNRTLQTMEIKTSKAVDLVETVQPDKMMIELQKSDAKVESLRAAIESNDTIIKSFRDQLKDFRKQVSVFQGVDQAVKLSDEVRAELMEIKKTEALVKRHASRVDDIFVEVSKKLGDYEKFEGQATELDKGFKKISTEFDGFKIKLASLAAKKDVETLLAKFNDFEKHAGNVLQLMDRRFEYLEKKMNETFEEKIKGVEKLLTGFEALAKKVPDLDKYFNLLSEEAKKEAQKAQQEAGAEPEKILQPGEEPPAETPQPKGGIMSKLKEKLGGGKKGEKEKPAEAAAQAPAS